MQYVLTETQNPKINKHARWWSCELSTGPQSVRHAGVGDELSDRNSEDVVLTPVLTPTDLLQLLREAAGTRNTQCWTDWFFSSISVHLLWWQPKKNEKWKRKILPTRTIALLPTGSIVSKKKKEKWLNRLECNSQNIHPISLDGFFSLKGPPRSSHC